MRELLTLPVDDGDSDDEAPEAEGDIPRLALVADQPAMADTDTDADDDVDGADHAVEDGREDREVHRVGAYAANGHEAVDRRTAERLRSRMEVSDLDGYRAKHGDRSYIAKHAAARLEASRYPMARTVGRVVAMKAAAATTAVVIGVAAAAAATTGIVATVVVPAINDHVRRPPATVPADKDDADTTRGEQRSGGGRDDDSPTATCSNVLLTCPPAVSVPAEPGDPAPATGSSTATTTPAATTTSSTTSTTDTTEPEPTTTTTSTTEPPPPTTEGQPATLEGGG
jgi:hypothetical protein